MKIVAVTSGKGGTGKSCIAAYTGTALAEAGRKTLLLETGNRPRSLDLITGATDMVYDITDVYAQNCSLKDAVVKTKLNDRLFLLPAGLCTCAVPSGRLMDLLKPLAAEYDCILVDDADSSFLTSGGIDTVLMVLTPDLLCLRSCAQQAQDLYGQNVRNMRLVINNVPPQVLPIPGIRDFDDIIDRIGVQLIAVIPSSPKLQHSSNHSAPLDRNSITVQVFENLAGRLEGRKCELLIR